LPHYINIQMLTKQRSDRHVVWKTRERATRAACILTLQHAGHVFISEKSLWEPSRVLRGIEIHGVEYVKGTIALFLLLLLAHFLPAHCGIIHLNDKRQ